MYLDLPESQINQGKCLSNRGNEPLEWKRKDLRNSFLDASSHLYERVCRTVCMSVKRTDEPRNNGCQGINKFLPL